MSADRKPSMVIYKYPLAGREGFKSEILMPKGARILSVANQRETICIWAEVDPNCQQTEVRKFEIVGTGHPIQQDSPMRFIGTVLVDGGNYVFHVYEIAA